MKKTLPIKRMTKQINRGASPAYDDDGHTKFINQACIYWAGIKYSAVKNADGKIHMPGSRGHLHKGDILVNSTGTGTLGRAAIFDKDNDEKYFADSHVTIVRPEPSALDSNYARYVIQSDLFQDKIYTFCVSGSTNQIELSRERFRELDLANIKLGDQRKAAVYLDKKTATIDKMIAAKNRTRTHLAELRTAIITKAVLGQRSSNDLQHTNIPWIGSIPAHWTLEKIKGVSDIVLGKMLQPAEKEGYTYKKYLRAQNIRWETVDIRSVNEMWFSPNELVTFRLKKGDILVTEGGEVGRAAMWQNELEECYIQNSINRLRAKDEKILPEFLLYVLESYGKAKVFEKTVNRVSIAHLTREKLKEYSLPLPPLSEQRQIVSSIKKRLDKIDKSDRILQKSITQLEEYRTSLISNVITGKVAV